MSISQEYIEQIIQKKVSGPKLYVTSSFKEACQLENELKGKVNQPILNLSLSEPNLYLPATSDSNYLNSLCQFINFLKSSEKPQYIVIASAVDLARLVPDPEFFPSGLRIEISDIIAPESLVQSLLNFGYQEGPVISEPGTFARRGEIFDIFLSNRKAFRLIYFDEMIEKVFELDPLTNRANREVEVEFFEISTGPEFVFGSKDHLNNLRTNIPYPESGHRNKIEKRSEVFKSISNDGYYPGYSQFYPLFFQRTLSLFELLKVQCCVYEVDSSVKSLFTEIRNEIEQTFHNKESTSTSGNFLPSPEKLYSFDIDWSEVSLRPFDDKERTSLYFLAKYQRKHLDLNLREILELLEKEKDSGTEIYIDFKRKSSEAYLKDLFPDFLFKSSFWGIKEGFYHSNSNSLVIAETELLKSVTSKKKERTSENEKDNFFADQVKTLQNGDYVIHQKFGIGKYEGLQSLKLSGNHSDDYVTLSYDGGDKVYVPVYKLNLLQKYSGSESETKLANLNSLRFDASKKKAKEAAKKLAFDLIKLQAERKNSVSYAYPEKNSMDKEFGDKFPYQLTRDQEKSVNAIYQNLAKTYPMDRLICGDVGFGKTEVAMRAAFKVASEGKQVVVLVPTTILNLQHFHSFRKRFSDFPINVDFVSRFKSTKDTAITYEKLKSGEVDIIVGTHKILSKKIEFKDLGLVIVDEEQKFGVAHKEKIKLLKASVDFLTLTATPIPRTLQMSFLGLKELSIIQSPPSNRQAVKTYVERDSDEIIQFSIERELSRKGQVFFVHNRVQDIEMIGARIQQLVPSAKIVVAHGQMGTAELEKKIADFYNQKYNVLISTTIIESGIDIPSANTLIVNKAQNFGLSQLHQLRGRIGRSNRQAFAYFLTPTYGGLSKTAQERIKAIEKYSGLGAGFSLASSDLDIRGPGNIVGAEQSGHIESVGLELYTQMVEEAAREIKGEQSKVQVEQIDIQFPDPIHIPSTFIIDTGERLSTYKKISTCSNSDDLSQMKETLKDVYGFIPEETLNLFSLVEVRNIIAGTCIQKINFGKENFVLKLDEAILNERPEYKSKIVDYFISRKKKFKVRPNFSVICQYSKTYSREQAILESESIARNTTL